MRYGIAVWNFMEAGVNLPARVASLADMGFDAVSFLPSQIANLGSDDAMALAEVMHERKLAATVHGDCGMGADAVKRIADLLGPHLEVLSIDPLMLTDSCGRFYDADRMSEVLLAARDRLGDESLRIAIEDFPLDGSAVAYYRRHISRLLDCAAYGILVDLGHLNLRRRREEYFKIDEMEYFTRLPVPVVEIHVHDNDGRSDSHMHLGRGNLDVEKTARCLCAMGFEGISTIEVAPSLHGAQPADSLPHLAKTLDLWRAAVGKAKREIDEQTLAR